MKGHALRPLFRGGRERRAERGADAGKIKVPEGRPARRREGGEAEVRRSGEGEKDNDKDKGKSEREMEIKGKGKKNREGT